jgi:glycosyltransferase involved in cell wall biosynthesis
LKILIASERFTPSVGGVETVTRLLGEAFVESGHSVTVVTNEAGTEANTHGCEVVRRPGAVQLLKCYRSAEAVILQGPLARLGWPLIFFRRPSLMVHHIESGTRANAVTRMLRRTLARRACHAAVSHALARALRVPVEAVLPNPYDHRVFHVDPKVGRKRECLFVGRLIPEKGAHIFIEALTRLKAMEVSVTATFVGEGPERERLKELIAARQLSQRVQFLGKVTGPALAELFNQHRILVVPSLQPEGFGLVALEGIACGCVVVGSSAGGLPEAIGVCGATVPAGDVASLTSTLQDLLRSSGKVDRFRTGAERHLAKHRSGVVARRYLELLQTL